MAQSRQYKVVLLGEAGVGKTNLLTQFVKGEFIEGQESTIGVAFFAHQITLPDNTIIKLELWDTAGQERYSGLAPLYYRGAHAAVVVYDITSMKSFERAKQWVKELRGQTDLNISIGLAGNKTDLDDLRKVSEKEANLYANDNGLLFIETSAKTGRNIKELFIRIATQLNAQPMPARKEPPLAVGASATQKGCAC